METVMIKVHTETGSVYEMDMPNLRMRRALHTEKSNDLRMDGEWIQMLQWPDIEQGYSMRIPLAPLAEGYDVTFRTTSPVTQIEGQD
jgi:hypothetical protein